MIIFDRANTAAELQGILDLQKANLKGNLADEEISSQGFLTVAHTFDQLSRMNAIDRHIIAKDNDRVIAYLLAMTQESKSDIPLLVPMFDLFNETDYKGRMVAACRYIVIGQACVDKSYRGQGILDKCYEIYKKYYSTKFDFAITEIAKSNTRSLNAHKRIGFKEISTHTSPGNTEWVIVAWDWQ